MSEPTPCGVCESGLAEAVDTLLYLGRDFARVAKELEQPIAFENQVRFHLFNRHVKHATADTYQMMIVVYQQDIRKLLDRELRRKLADQDNRRIDTCHKGIRWSIEQVAKAEGLYIDKLTPYRNKIRNSTNELLDAVNAFAEANPGAAKRIKDAAERQKPVLIEAQPEVVKSPMEKAAEKAESNG